MSALEELQNGTTGDQFLYLLSRTVAAVARAGNYPPPSGGDHWDADDVRGVVADFLVAEQTPRRLTDLRSHCRTDDALKRRLQRTVKNFFADMGRRTPVGKLVRRFNEVLESDDGFERHGIYWRLVGTKSEPPVVDFDRLGRVISAVEVVVPTAWKTGGRESPEIDAPSVVRLSKAALNAACGPLRPADLAKLAAERVGLGRAPLSIESLAFEPVGPDGVSHSALGAAGLVNLLANEVLVRLNEFEILAVGLAELSTEALGEVMGVSGSKAHLVRRRTVAILQDELANEEHGQATAEALFEMAKTWSERWIREHGPT